MIIELFSGIGRSLGDDAIRVDFDPRTKPTICADVRNLPLRPGLHFTHAHASPPCKYMSRARRWRYGWNVLGIAESMELAASAFRAFDYLDADKYSFEWAGSEDFFGHRLHFKYDKADIRNVTTTFYHNKKSLKRSVIPKEIMNQVMQDEEKKEERTK